jgi:membrane protein implicated in regulation of membrane protease activity
MDVWVIWLAAACLLGVGEIHRGGFYLGPIALGTGAAALVSLLDVGVLLSVLVFALTSGIAFAALRPVADRNGRLPSSIRTGAAALIGRRAMVLERIANDEAVGCVKIDGGEVWTARSYEEDEVIDVGERVEVVEIRGATALVTH